MEAVISLGAGVQSTTMALMARDGEFEVVTPKLAIFADTGWEPKAVYEHLSWLEEELAPAIRVVRVALDNIRERALRVRQSKGGGEYQQGSPPLFMLSEDGSKGMAPRQCTRDYKIDPIRRWLRSEGYQGQGIEQWMGISLDEVQRMKDSSIPWIKHRYPLIEREITRQGCLDWMEAHEYPQPPRSACIGCPYHSDAEWRRLRDDSPEEWADAVEWERELQEMSVFKGTPYLHASRVPLAEVDLATAEDRGQLTMLDECEGMCGV